MADRVKKAPRQSGGTDGALIKAELERRKRTIERLRKVADALAIEPVEVDASLS